MMDGNPIHVELLDFKKTTGFNDDLIYILQENFFMGEIIQPCQQLVSSISYCAPHI